MNDTEYKSIMNYGQYGSWLIMMNYDEYYDDFDN